MSGAAAGTGTTLDALERSMSRAHCLRASRIGVTPGFDHLAGLVPHLPPELATISFGVEQHLQIERGVI
jgi:hypothetical protein